MEPKNNFGHAGCISAFSLFLFFICISGMSVAKEPGGMKLPGEKRFIFTTGVGYGLSNNPTIQSDKNTIGGMTLAFSMGYRISDKVTLEFGPQFWIEGNDLTNSGVADNQRPDNKRMIVTFTGTYSPFKMLPLSFKLGGGAGVLNYTPDKSVVVTDEQKFDKTEIFKGWSGTCGIAWEFKLSEKVKLYPSLNLWYIDLQPSEIPYQSYIDHTRPSITSDLRLNLKFNF